MKNYNSFRDINMLEKYVNDDITEQEFDQYFEQINEKISFKVVANKAKNIINWLVDNIKKVGMKIAKIAMKVFNMIKNVLPKKLVLSITLILLMLVTNVAIGNVTGEGDKVQGDKTELVITERQINESKELMNTVIGFMTELKETENIKDRDIIQAIGTLASIRDSLSVNNLNAETYKYMSEESKILIETVISFMKEEINKAIQSKDENIIKALYSYYEIGKKFETSFMLYGRNFRHIKIINMDGKEVANWSMSLSGG